MARQKTPHLTPLELEIMHVLWNEGASNVQAVQQHLERELAYTTVQTMLNILHRKGKVKRILKDRASGLRGVKAEGGQREEERDHRH